MKIKIPPQTRKERKTSCQIIYKNERNWTGIEEKKKEVICLFIFIFLRSPPLLGSGALTSTEYPALLWGSDRDALTVLTCLVIFYNAVLLFQVFLSHDFRVTFFVSTCKSVK